MPPFLFSYFFVSLSLQPFFFFSLHIFPPVLLSQLQSSFIPFFYSLGLPLMLFLPLPPSLRLLGISLLAQFTQPTHFMGLIPFLTVCLQVWGQVLICLSLFLPSLVSSLSFASLSLSPHSPTDGSSYSPFFLSFTDLTLFFYHSFPVFLNLCITLCLFVSLMFSSTTPLHPFDSSSSTLLP